MSLLNIPVKSFGLAPEFTLPDEEEQESLTSSKTKLTTQTVEDAIGEFGLFQKVLYFLLWFPAAAMAIGVYASVYLEYTPSPHSTTVFLVWILKTQAYNPCTTQVMLI